MASRENHLDDEDDFPGNIAGNPSTTRSGNKRSFMDVDEDEDDIFGSKKAHLKVEDTAPGVTTGMILSLRESLQNCKDNLASCQTELEAAKSEIDKWRSAFQDASFIPPGTTPEPNFVVSYLQNLRSSEESLKDQLEKARKKEAAFIVTFAKREQEIADLKSAVRDLRAQLRPPSMQARRLLLDPAIHEEFMRLKNLVAEKDKKVKELEDNIAAVVFTPQSKMGKSLMAKCRTLQEENEEIGHQANEGKLQELSMKLALQKSHNAELKGQFEGLCKQMQGLTNDCERSNEMVIILQEKLEERDAEIRRLKHELNERNMTETAKEEKAADADADENADADAEANANADVRGPNDNAVDQGGIKIEPEEESLN